MNHAHFLRIKGLSQKSTRSKNLDLVMPRVMAHNLREIVAEIGAEEGSHIDPTKTKHNVILRGHATSSAVNKAVQTLMRDVRVSKWRKDTISAIELIFSLSAQSPISPELYFRDAVEWAGTFFKVPIISAVIHLDEDAPHCHVVLIPIKDGRLCGSEVMGNKKHISSMQEDFHVQVGKRFGLVRQSPQKRHSAVIRREAIETAFNILEPISGIHSEILRVILEGNLNNPEPVMQALSLAMPKAKIKGTFVGIMTKPVKADKSEKPKQTPKEKPIEVQNMIPIEVQPANHTQKRQPLSSVLLFPPVGRPANHTQKRQPLSCVEVRFPEPVISQDADALNTDYKRERDSDNESSDWDETLGEFVKRPYKASLKPIVKRAVQTALDSI